MSKPGVSDVKMEELVDITALYYMIRSELGESRTPVAVREDGSPK